MMNLHPPLRAPRRQQGNTLIGLIIGLVIGLVIAVIVALAITKGATPFTDKMGKTGKTSEPSGGQVTDPNQPMYGKVVKPPVAEIPPPVQPPPPPQDPLQQLLANLQPDPTPVAKPAPKPIVSPTRPDAAAKPDAGDDKFVYYLQAGAFRNMEEAENTRARLALMGFEATVTDRNTDNGVLHRVRLGPFGGLDAMNRVRAKMTENGVDVAVVRNQKPIRE
jgi:cell division protein FtsN